MQKQSGGDAFNPKRLGCERELSQEIKCDYEERRGHSQWVYERWEAKETLREVTKVKSNKKSVVRWICNPAKSQKAVLYWFKFAVFSLHCADVRQGSAKTSLGRWKAKQWQTWVFLLLPGGATNTNTNTNTNTLKNILVVKWHQSCLFPGGANGLQLPWVGLHFHIPIAFKFKTLPLWFSLKLIQMLNIYLIDLSLGCSRRKAFFRSGVQFISFRPVIAFECVQCYLHLWWYFWFKLCGDSSNHLGI